MNLPRALAQASHVTRPLLKWVFILLIVVTLAAQESPFVKVPDANHVMWLSGGPTKPNLLVFASRQEPEGEYPIGFLSLVRFAASPHPSVSCLPLQQFEDDGTFPVWRADGNTVYFLGSEGLYALSTETGKTNLLFRGQKGLLAGLALSPDERKIAFWDLAPRTERHAYALTLFDLELRRTVRTWLVDDNYAADQYGFEMAFTADGMAILAKTYDSEHGTPLKQFRLDAADSRLIWPDCDGPAATEKAVYFIAKNGPRRSLMKLSPGDRTPQTVMQDFLFDSIRRGGGRNSIVAYDGRTRTYAIFDAEKGTLAKMGRKWNAVSVLSTGELVCARGASLFVCSSLPSP